MAIRITKTDFLEYSFCRKNLWLKKHKPELFDGLELSDFEIKIIREGNIADEAARKLFPQGILIESTNELAVGKTQQLLQEGKEVLFQAAFEYEGFFIRSDVMVFDTERNGWELYEVKASTKVKNSPSDPQNHVTDLAFQKEVMESCGLVVTKTGVIHLNNKYTRHGELDYDELFMTVDISDDVAEVTDAVRAKMQEMKEYLQMPEEKGCDCLLRGRSKHCSTFAYSNPKVPEYAIYDLFKIGNSKRKIETWVDEQRFALDEVREDELNERQRLQVETYLKQVSYVDKKKIAELLNGLEFPLCFFDYEGLIAAIPLYEGFSPFEQIPFQYSLHILHEDGSVDHTEHIITKTGSDMMNPLVEQLVADAGIGGTFVSWHAVYERGRNDKLIELYPQHAAVLNAVNEKMFDLEEIFTKNLYAHYGFKGKTSIKYILPVLVPELSYKTLSIQKGDHASERWEHMMKVSTSAEEKEQIKQDLLEYCKMDTWAMVMIYKHLVQECIEPTQERTVLEYI